MRIPRILGWSSWALAAALAAAPARASSSPAPESLLDDVLAGPAVPYEGRVMVTQWYGRRTRAEEMLVRVLPPDRVRREFLAPDGTVTRVAISDGRTESVRLLLERRIVIGDAAGAGERTLGPDQERETLLKNYSLSAGAAAKVAGRPSWTLTLRPRTPGKEWLKLWIDQETKVVLRSKRYLPHRPFASQAQFSSFEPKPQDESLFQVESSTGPGVIFARGPAPRFLSLEELNRDPSVRLALPSTLPGGFVFESADIFPVKGRKVRHARYTDGLTVLSVFETDRPVRLPKGGLMPVGPADLPGSLRSSRAGKVLQWKAGKRHFILMGDVSRELLVEIARAVR